MTENQFSAIEDLPEQFPIFPLPGCVLFPRERLPLNIFEPRYLNMIDDALAGDNVIGMVQSLDRGPKAHPEITHVGCLGQIEDFTETADGRYLIVLRGIARFLIRTELPLEKPYREVLADWQKFGHDLSVVQIVGPLNTDRLLAAFERYLTRNGFEASWEGLQESSPEQLINALAASCPFSVAEKQALLEAPNLPTRCQILIGLLDMSGHESGGSESLQ